MRQTASTQPSSSVASRLFVAGIFAALLYVASPSTLTVYAQESSEDAVETTSTDADDTASRISESIADTLQESVTPESVAPASPAAPRRSVAGGGPPGTSGFTSAPPGVAVDASQGVTVDGDAATNAAAETSAAPESAASSVLPAPDIGGRSTIQPLARPESVPGRGVGRTFRQTPDRPHAAPLDPLPEFDRNIAAGQQLKWWNWGKYCPPNGNALQNCIVQAAVYTANSTPDNYRRLAAYGLQFDANGRPAGQVVITPLNVLLRRGIRLRIDNGPSIDIPFTLCSSQGCIGLWPADDVTVNALKRGGNLFVTYRDRRDQRLEYTVPLDGFTATAAGEPTRTTRQGIN